MAIQNESTKGRSQHHLCSSSIDDQRSVDDIDEYCIEMFPQSGLCTSMEEPPDELCVRHAFVAVRILSGRQQPLRDVLSYCMHLYAFVTRIE